MSDNSLKECFIGSSVWFPAFMKIMFCNFFLRLVKNFPKNKLLHLSANWLFGIKPDLQFSLKTGSLLYIILLYYVWLPNDISHIGLVIDRKKFFFSGVKPSLQLLWRVFSPLFWEIMFYNKKKFSNLIENRSPICSIWN